MSTNLEFLKERSLWVREETLKIHKIAPETRLASSLSCIEIFAVLYYGKVLNYDHENIKWEYRDRLIISKSHGAISLYPILADIGFFEKERLNKVCKENSFLSAIPDCNVPGFETINGSLGHGLGVGCGIAIGLKRKKSDSKVFVLMGDGELWEGSIWEAVQFAGHHCLDNIILIIDKNQKSMLDFCSNIIDLEPLEEKFDAFKWKTSRKDGHNIEQLYHSLIKMKIDSDKKPKVLIADTVKGKGVKKLEKDPICHVKNLACEDIDEILANYRTEKNVI